MHTHTLSLSSERYVCVGESGREWKRVSVTHHRDGLSELPWISISNGWQKRQLLEKEKKMYIRTYFWFITCETWRSLLYKELLFFCVLQCEFSLCCIFFFLNSFSCRHYSLTLINRSMDWTSPNFSFKFTKNQGAIITGQQWSGVYLVKLWTFSIFPFKLTLQTTAV